jgi:hypothetical protein
MRHLLPIPDAIKSDNFAPGIKDVMLAHNIWEY